MSQDDKLQRDIETLTHKYISLDDDELHSLLSKRAEKEELPIIGSRKGSLEPVINRLTRRITQEQDVAAVTTTYVTQSVIDWARRNDFDASAQRVPLAIMAAIVAKRAFSALAGDATTPAPLPKKKKKTTKPVKPARKRRTSGR